MTDVLVYVQTRRGAVQDVSWTAVGAGLHLKTALGGRLFLGVNDPAPDKVAATLAIAGVDEVVTTSVVTEGFDAEVEESTAITMLEETGASVLVLGHGVDAMAVAPAVAARLGAGLATDVIGVGVDDGRVSAERAAFGGALVEQLSFPKEKVVLTVRDNAYPSPAAAAAGTVSTRELVAPDVMSRTGHLRWIDPAAGGIDITKHDLLLSVGRAIGGPEDVERVEKIALALGGVMSASRPVVDAGWAEKSRQVGQTGKTVKPKVYLAMGISGAIQHLAGISGAETVIAVNTDPAAPILQTAAYIADVDLHELIDALEQLVGV